MIRLTLLRTILIDGDDVSKRNGDDTDKGMAMMVGKSIINSSSERDGQDRVRMQESEVEGSCNRLIN